MFDFWGRGKYLHPKRAATTRTDLQDLRIEIAESTIEIIRENMAHQAALLAAIKKEVDDLRAEIRAETMEQARLLGMSGEREAALLGKIERLQQENLRLKQENLSLANAAKQSTLDA